MGRRPSFQFYPSDWSSNSNLRRCTHEQKGAWLDAMCLMHDSEEYGILRWPLKEIGQAIGCKVSVLVALVDKGVMKGADPDQTCEPFTFTPCHAGKQGATVTLIPSQSGPVWYSSRMVRDEYVRSIRGESTRFKASGGDSPNPPPNQAPIPPPKPPFGDGPSSSSSSSSPTKVQKIVPAAPARNRKPRTDAASLEEILHGGKGTPTYETYWKLVATFGGSPKNPAPKTTAQQYMAAITAGNSPELIQGKAQQLRDATGEAKYMPQLRTWLDGQGWLNPDLPKPTVQNSNRRQNRGADTEASFRSQLDELYPPEAS